MPREVGSPEHDFEDLVVIKENHASYRVEDRLRDVVEIAGSVAPLETKVEDPGPNIVKVNSGVPISHVRDCCLTNDLPPFVQSRTPALQTPRCAFDDEFV